MAKAQLVTRATASGTNTENLNKGSALTHAEMDKNLIGLRDASFGIADDSSTVLSVTDDKTITIAGGTGITTALSGDTLTITNSGVSLSGSTNNTIATVTGTDALNGEANLTFDGSTLAVTGNITATTSIANDAISIDDNEIKTTRSNDNLRVSANGTGAISIGSDDFYGPNAVYENYYGSQDLNKIAGFRFDQSVDANTAARAYGVGIAQSTTVTGSSSSNSNFRQRAMNVAESVDMAGFSYTRSGDTRGPAAAVYATNIVNTDTTASTINAITGASNWAAAYADSSTYAAGDITINEAIANAGTIELYSGSHTGNFAMTNAYAFKTYAFIDGSNDTLTNMYGFYHGASSSQTGTITNNYAFYDATNSLSVFGDIQTQAVSITDNLITTNRSNDNLNISANGTGDVVITQSNNYPGLSNNPRNVMYYEDAATTFGTRNYSNNIYGVFKIDSGQSDSSSSNDRYRNVFHMELDLNGKDSTATSSALTRGPQNAIMTIVNNTASGNSTLGNANGAQNLLSPRTEGSGDLTITESAAHSSSVEADAASGTTITLTDTYGYHSSGYSTSGSGTHAVTNFTHFYAQTNRDASSITNEYAFYSEDDTAKSRVGSLERYREKINSLTSSSTITVDCGLAPVHTVTLGTNTGFNIANLGTGQSVTIIITQDGTGSRTASFGTDGSAAVKFAGTYSALSTAAGAIDVVTIFNDGTNFLGNCAKAYA